MKSLGPWNSYYYYNVLLPLHHNTTGPSSPIPTPPQINHFPPTHQAQSKNKITPRHGLLKIILVGHDQDNIFLRCVAIKIAVSVVSVEFDQQQEISNHSFVSTWKTDNALKDRFEISFIAIPSFIVVFGIVFVTYGIDSFNPIIIKAKMPLKNYLLSSCPIILPQWYSEDFWKYISSNMNESGTASTNLPVSL